jgi:hypothetical protein
MMHQTRRDGRELVTRHFKSLENMIELSKPEERRTVPRREMDEKSNMKTDTKVVLGPLTALAFSKM